MNLTIWSIANTLLIAFVAFRANQRLVDNHNISARLAEVEVKLQRIDEHF